MKRWLTYSFLFAALLGLACFVLPSTGLSQDTAPAPIAAPSETPTDAALPAEAATIISSVAEKFPWITTVFFFYGIAGSFWQVVITFAHKHVASTAHPEDDAWLKGLEEKAWFRILDKFFYWGGYLGAALGKRKL